MAGIRKEKIEQDFARKEFTHRSYVFRIDVRFNTKTEKRKSGETWHMVTIYSVGSDDFDKSKEVSDRMLESSVSDYEVEAKNFVDNKLDGKKAANKRLLLMGFK